MELLNLLHVPDREFTPFPFWFLNGAFSHKELRCQLEDFAVHGVYGVVAHPRMGIPKHIGYLTDKYFSYIRTIIKTAHELNMKVVLYDEGMYPSGSAKGFVVEGHPHLASEGITLVQEMSEGDELLAETEKGLLVARKSRGTMRGIYWGEDDGEPNAPASADILNPEAVDRFISLTHDAYYNHFAEYFGSTIIGFFTDEPSVLGRNPRGKLFPWTHGFSKDFKDAGGSLSSLTALFENKINKDTELYDKMILQRECEVYYGKLSIWCETHGIALMGHPHQSDDIEVQRYFHIPGQDLVLRWLAPEKSGIAGMDSTMGKCSSDAARLMNRRRNSNEVFGACNKDNNPWLLSGGDMKWYLDWLGVRGVNMFIPHAFYYSIAGKRKDERPPDVGPNNIWWKHYKLWADYMGRLSCLMTDVEVITPVAVLCRNRNLCPEIVAPLFEKQIGFQYFPESAWNDCTIEGTELVYKGKRYQAVIGDTKNMFEGVNKDISNVLPDCYTNPYAPMLRSAHFIRAGKECWFLVNEGNEPIQTTITLPTSKYIGKYNLWTDVSNRQPFRHTEKGAQFELRLDVRESMLFFVCEDVEYQSLEMPQEVTILHIPELIMVNEDKATCRKIYSGSVFMSAEDLAEGSYAIQLEGNDMAELVVNGKLAGASFWTPHFFELKNMLQEGCNELEIIFTGSMANKYGRPVEYGYNKKR